MALGIDRVNPDRCVIEQFGQPAYFIAQGPIGRIALGHVREAPEKMAIGARDRLHLDMKAALGIAIDSRCAELPGDPARGRSFSAEPGDPDLPALVIELVD